MANSPTSSLRRHKSTNSTKRCTKTGSSVNRRGGQTKTKGEFQIGVPKHCIGRLFRLRKQLGHQSSSQTLDWLLDNAEKRNAGKASVQGRINENPKHAFETSNCSSSSSPKDLVPLLHLSSGEPSVAEDPRVLEGAEEFPPLDFDTFSKINVEFMTYDSSYWITWIESSRECKDQAIKKTIQSC